MCEHSLLLVPLTPFTYTNPKISVGFILKHHLMLYWALIGAIRHSFLFDAALEFDIALG